MKGEKLKRDRQRERGGEGRRNEERQTEGKRVRREKN